MINQNELYDRDRKSGCEVFVESELWERVSAVEVRGMQSRRLKNARGQLPVLEKQSPVAGMSLY